MLIEDRRSKIQELLFQRNTITIAELASLLGASEMTIRRDLNALADRKVCQRVHGGAVALRAQEHRPAIPSCDPAYPTYQQREYEQVPQKIAIGRAAAEFVSSGDVIAVDTGTTAAYLARELRNAQPITVITNSLRVIDQLQDVPQITLICPGGIIPGPDRNALGGDLAFVGPIATATLRTFHASKAFITTSGLHVRNGISNASLFQTEIKRTLIEIADQAILIADHTKFGRAHGFLVASLTAFHTVITDNEAPVEDVEALRALGIQVVQVAPCENADVLHSMAMAAFAGSDRF